ncbi:HET-domain-containing protein [Neurospora tetraspora]|uniref:HET-domain-containing protein n=1 Tax=Neurospora tetraspora TaxID=94610 RepID=A0AAE0J137_9PEZI|nr:HET-domain-containing protein [Neurospora tetraspora]
MSTRLCAVCNAIFTGLLVNTMRMPHHRSVASLRRSVEEGCYICIFFVAAMPQYNIFNANGAFSWGLNMVPEGRRWNFGPYTSYGQLAIESNSHTFLFSPNAPINTVNPGASLTDQAVMETARSWLENCRKNHALCQPVDPAFNPTRLIYIHNASSVQLIETKEEANSQHYVAFSHCWGESETLKLLQNDLDKGTKGNIEELRSLIQVQRLPTSYWEAISVSLALGFRHIWIDSLCIIQNSDDDWTKESAMMKDVYASSSLNLCASAAADASEASFRRRALGMIVPLDIEPQWTGILHGVYNLGKIGPLPSHLRQIKIKLERVLSRRHLHMTCNQLWWDCRHICASEMFPAGVPIGEDKRNGEHEEERVRYYALSTFGPHSPHHGAPSEVDMDKLWDSLVERYSRCNLTYTSDKLPALSGLAQIFSIVRGPDFSLDKNSYLAGIWRPHLPYALCWYSYYGIGGKLRNYDGKLRNYRPHPYRAPSWSWASVEGSVAAGKLSGKPVCCVVDVKVLHEDERYKAGTVKGGILNLRSRVIGPFTYKPSSTTADLTTSPSLDSRVREAIDALRMPWFIKWDERDGVSGKDFISYLDPLPQTVHKDGIVKGTGAVRKTVRLEALTEELRMRIFLVPIVLHLNKGWWGGGGGGVAGLIVCHVVNDPGLEGFDDGAVFQRVGWFENLDIDDEVLLLVPGRTIAII